MSVTEGVCYLADPELQLKMIGYFLRIFGQVQVVPKLSSFSLDTFSLWKSIIWGVKLRSIT